MDYVPAAMLWLLTIIRIPTLLDSERASVLRATFFAALACTLFVPAVYNAADPILGGSNHVGLVLVVTIMAAFWQFHTATILATFSDEPRRRRHLMRGRLAAAVAGTCVVVDFFSSHVEVTNQNLPLAYGDQPGMQLFLWMGSVFIIWLHRAHPGHRHHRGRTIPHLHGPPQDTASTLTANGRVRATRFSWGKADAAQSPPPDCPTTATVTPG